jgi:hypothetical protein
VSITRVRTTRAAVLLPPLGYLLLSLPVFGGVWLDLQSSVVGRDDIDPSGFIWCLAWWPNALLDGVDPFVTDALLVPEGYNLTWAASMPAPALLMAPITFLASATVTFNLLMLLSPPLSAWAAYALCRHVTGAAWPSFLGGYLFGFSPYMLGAMRGGAPNLTMVALIPLMVLLVIKRTEGSLSRGPFVGLMVAALVLQIGIGSEVMATATLFGAVTLVIAYGLFADHRPRLLETVKLLVVAYALAGLVLAPFLLAMLEPHATPEHADPRTLVIDVASLVVPEQLELGGGTVSDWWDRLGISYLNGGPSYLGPLLLALLVGIAWERRRERVALLLVGVIATCLVASLGPRLTVGGDALVPLPWELFVHLPLFRYAIPMRFAMFTFLALAVLLATWLAARPSPARWAIALAAVAFLAPNVRADFWNADAQDPAFFETDLYRAELDERDRVLALPVWGKNARWAARTNIGFRLVGGYVGSMPDSYQRFPAWATLTSGHVDPSDVPQVRRLMRAKGATVVVVERVDAPAWQPLLDSLRTSPRERGGVLVYHLSPPG